MVQADLLMAQGKKEEVRVLLEEAKLEGADDALRQARLALLHAREPWKAMEVIDAGLRNTPRSAELLSFRAQIQEAAGRIADARLDYVAAILSAPSSALHRDVLANFQLRIGEPSNAADTWRDAAEVTHVGVFAFKAWFWSKVCGVPLSRPLPDDIQVDWKNVMKEIGKLKDGAYISDALDQEMAGIRNLRQRPEVRWMNLINAMHRADWNAALGYLDLGFPKAAETMAPGLATRLFVNLRAISGSSAREALVGRELPLLTPEPHPFLREFDEWKTSATKQEETFTRWLATPASLAATLFAHGWQGAALDIAGGASLAPVSAAPEWFDFGYARCLIIRDGSAAARKWLETMPKLSTAAQLTYGEILLTGGDVEKGMQQLTAIANEKSPHAGRAAWTVALAEVDRGNAAEASRWVKGNDELLASVGGKEILARCALAVDARDEALRIYRDLGASSTDALIYLSKEAFAKKDWQEARKWTEELARRFPNEPQFRNNLLRIDADEAQKP
jgi:tetratricopeptide (TPR) repeat protein